MSMVDHSQFRHSHDFVRDFSKGERRTRLVIAITGVMMVVEITAGVLSHSMALLADGWHMSTHVTAFLITAIAYYFMRRHSSDAQFSFGTGKIGVLGGFASAVVLSVVALLMAGESVHRLFVPLTIHFNEAIGIACVALTVNLVCALLLKEDHHRAHDHHGEDGHQHTHPPSVGGATSGAASDHDLNLRAAYLHVLADAFTTCLAIIALTSGKFFGWFWLDPVVGLIGSAVVFSWAYTLLRDTSGILVDRTPLSLELPQEIRRAVESDGDSTVSDLHVWQVGAGKFAAIVSIVAHEPKTSEHYRDLLCEHKELVHLTIETQVCHERHETIVRP
ncbi:MAG TPA: CDF family Co(II)/Ni(II) efflux transporter DmeF [Chthoniobacterales bacterium]|jgi:cation diffusion facilitator family transporter|nr:CDF family Co(II)/Ni(II) efflux transporter DmeF [Chthoniobacterales bacterium]